MHQLNQAIRKAFRRTEGDRLTAVIVGALHQTELARAGGSACEAFLH